MDQTTRCENSPAAFRHPGDVTLERQFPEAQPAQRELAHVGARAAAQAAPVAQPNLVLRRLQFFRTLGCRCHVFSHSGGPCPPVLSLTLPKRHADELQQLARLFIGLRRSDDRHVHAARLVDLHVVDLGEQELISQAERVVAAAVETFRRHALEVADARKRDRHQAIEELPHALAAQGHHARDGHAFSDFERRDRLLRAARHRLLPRDARELVGADVHELGVARRLAEAHVHDDLLNLRDRHHVLVAELFLQSRDDVLGVLVSQSRAHLSTTPSHLRQTRTFLPSPRILWPTRVCAPHSGHTSCTLDAWTDASRSTMPPWICLPGFGFVWRLIMFTPSMTRRFFSGTTRSTRPRLPRSLPVMTSTLSFFRIGVASRDITEPLVPAK